MASNQVTFPDGLSFATKGSVADVLEISWVTPEVPATLMVPVKLPATKTSPELSTAIADPWLSAYVVLPELVVGWPANVETQTKDPVGPYLATNVSWVLLVVNVFDEELGLKAAVPRNEPVTNVSPDESVATAFERIAECDPVTPTPRADTKPIPLGSDRPSRISTTGRTLDRRKGRVPFA